MPEQCAMKSDRHAERTADFCAAVGALGITAVVAFACAGGFFAGSTGCAGSAGAVVTAVGAEVTADLHPGDKSVAFACRQSTISGLVGAIQEQCAAMSSNVHARRTAFNRSSCDAAAGVCSGAAAGGTVSAAAGVSAEAGAAAGLRVTASMAVLHDDERLS
jgi:hypothetical protein